MPETEPRNTPPSLSLKLIRLWCRDELYEEVEGNLIEYFYDQEKPWSAKSQIKYWRQVLSYLRPATFKKFQSVSRFNMFSFNPKLTLRNLWNHRTLTAINLGGFTLGLLCVFYLYFYIKAELGYDSFHKDKDQIYRVLRVGEINGNRYKIGVTSGPYAGGLETDYPGSIATTCRVLPEEGLVTFGDNTFYEDQMVFVDDNFFHFFSFPLSAGQASGVFSNQNSVVISNQIARKYFGDNDPVGKTITVDNQFDFMVTGILDEFPAKSHLEFEMVFPIKLYNQFDWFHNWWSNSLVTYVKIDTPEEAAKVEKTFTQFMDKYFGEDFKRSGNKVGLTFEPLSETYFTNDTRYDEVLHGNLNTIYILIIVAIAILSIASFNYMNLSVAQSFKRAKEVGVRKMLGGSVFRLTLQFLGEAIILLILSMGLAVFLAELFLPYLNGYFGLDVQLQWTDRVVILFLLVLFVGTMVLSGLYPALQMASFQPLRILKGVINPSSKTSLRKVLVIGQFIISIFMIITTLLVSYQLKYLSSKELGFNQNAILMIDINNRDIRDKLESFKSELSASSYVQSVSLVSGEPGGFHDASTFLIEGVQEKTRMRTLFTDHDYLKTFEIDLLAGSDFQDIVVEGMNAGILFNSTAVEELGFSREDLFGRKVEMPGWDIERTVIGVVDDFHFLSLHNDMEPLAIIQGGRPRRVAIRFEDGALAEGLDHVNALWGNMSPSYPISYEFLDDSLFQLYNNEIKQSHVFTVFSTVSIFLACLGVLGLTSYSARQRQKEFGIRKVLGASVAHIISLISREFLILISISSLVAIPIAGFFMSKWLSEFAYHINLISHWPLFIAGGLAAAIIAWFTVGFMTYRSAILKPTDSIRNE